MFAPWAHSIALRTVRLIFTRIGIFETHAAPVEAVCDPVLELVGVWDSFLVNMQDFGIVMVITTTVVNMHVSPHRRAYKIAQHRGTVIFQ
jgi:hypothetical protein